MTDVVAPLSEELFFLQDLKYKAFHSRLIPSVNPDYIIGVRPYVLGKVMDKIKL